MISIKKCHLKSTDTVNMSPHLTDLKNLLYQVISCAFAKVAVSTYRNIAHFCGYITVSHAGEILSSGWLNPGTTLQITTM